ncbi:MAG: malate dehydrogenase [Syntrophales bacterium]|nr:malate dehydrogenase [Syntrophales bacterium]MDD5232835.1 malate dehydrogenase [Syntrophales bacterium]MDD5531865.1 malate dehydrogenase [Syntrophales bacterium]
MREKVAVIGAGFVGTMTAQRIAEKNLADVVLVDIIEGVPQGKALDMNHAASLVEMEAAVQGTNDFAEIRDSRVVVVTAGFPRMPGMSREELAAKNGKIIQSVVSRVREFAPECVLLIVTNPLDIMAYTAWKLSGFPARRVLGMGGVLDTARYEFLLARELGVSVRDIDALVIGSHGDTMIPLVEYSRARGVPIKSLLPEDRIEKILERTKNSGAEIVGLLKTGSAFHAPSASAAAMVEAVLKDSGRLLAASVLLEGQYGIRDVFIGAPIRLGADGVESIYEIVLSAAELQAYRDSAAAIRQFLDKISAS